jgi:hypothetical protein
MLPLQLLGIEFFEKNTNQYSRIDSVTSNELQITSLFISARRARW